MSALETHTDVREHPTSGGVTVAARGAELEADVQRKIKLWGVIEAFNDGRLPDNKQIDDALAYTVDHAPVDVSKLSPEGKVLIDDIRDIVETMREIVSDKNGDELIQNTLFQSYTADLSSAKQQGVAPVSKDDVAQDANQAAAHLRVLVTLFLTNGEARKLLSDFGIIGRDIFANAAVKAADKVRPSRDDLEQVDHEAPSKQWMGAEGQIHGTESTPEIQFKGPSGTELRYHPKDAPSEARTWDHQGNQRTAGEVYDNVNAAKQDFDAAKQDVTSRALGSASTSGGNATDQARYAADQGSSVAGQVKQQAQPHVDDLLASRDPNASYSQQKDQVLGRAQEKAPDDVANLDTDEAKEQAKGKLAQLRDKIPEEHRARAANAVDATRDIVRDSFPEERRDQFIYRLKKVLVEVQQHKDYAEAMTWLLDTLERYKGHSQHVAGKGAQSVQDAADDPTLSGSVSNFGVILERFANGRSLKPVLDALDQLYSDADADPALREWWGKADDYVHRVLLEPGFVLEDESDRDARELKEAGKYFFQEKYKGHWDRLWDELTTWLKAFNEDPLNVKFGNDWKRLTKDLLFDAEGNLTFKPKLWADIRHVVVPGLIRQIGYIPIPRAEYTDDKLDLVIENLILSGPNLFPNVITMENHNYFKFSPYDTIKDTNHHRFRVGLSQIQADIRDVRFAFKKKSGFPKMSDAGIADVILARHGISVDIEIETVENRRDSVFRVVHVNTKVDQLSFSIRQSKHDLLYKFIKGAATSTIKKAISSAVETAVRSALGHLDDQLVEVRNTMDEAKQSDETTRTQALKDLYARKRDAAQSKAESASQEANRRGSQFRIVADRDSQLLPQMAHDEQASISKRIWKTEDVARSGKQWHSPAFSIVGDDRHPAQTGHHHPDAVQGAGAGKSLTSRMQGEGANESTSPSATSKAEADTAAAVQTKPTPAISGQSTPHVQASA